MDIKYYGYNDIVGIETMTEYEVIYFQYAIDRN